MRVIVRADGDARIGMGHLERSVALATALGEVTVVARQPGALRQWARTRGVHLAHAATAAGGLAHLAEVAERRRADLVLLDLFELGESDWPEVAVLAGRVPVASYGNRHRLTYPEAVVINHDTLAMEFGYRSGPAGGTRFLLGPDYFVLRPELRRYLPGTRDARPTVRPLGPGLGGAHPGVASRVLLGLGGADPLGLTPHYLRSVLSIPALEVDVLMGAAVPSSVVEETRRVAALEGRGRARLWEGARDIGGLIAAADLALVGAGGMVSECMALGAPVFAVSQNREQALHMRPLSAAGELVHIEAWRGRDAGALRGQVVRWLGDAPGRAALRWAGQRRVDGEGLARCVRELRGLVDRDARGRRRSRRRRPDAAQRSSAGVPA